MKVVGITSVGWQGTDHCLVDVNRLEAVMKFLVSSPAMGRR